MATRVREYTGMLLDRLIRNDVMAREGCLPWTLAVVVYNGGERWTAVGEESHLARVPALVASDLRCCSRSSIGALTLARVRSRIGLSTIECRRRVRLQRRAAPDELWPRLSAEAHRFPGPGATCVSRGAARLGEGDVGKRDGGRSGLSVL